MKKLVLCIVLVSCGIILLSNCSQRTKYKDLVKAGLESGERHDTLFLGLYLGMSSEEFYKKCWELNKQGLIRQGEGNTSVLYEMRDEFKSEVNVNFYPTFFDDLIYEMPVKFTYNAWAPWNKQYSSDTLQMELVDLFEKWYGSGFMEVKHSQKGTAYVKLDGNRRISIYKEIGNSGTVWALYTDMSVDQEAKQEKKKESEE